MQLIPPVNFAPFGLDSSKLVGCSCCILMILKNALFPLLNEIKDAIDKVDRFQDGE